MKKRDQAPKKDGITRQPFPNSSKVYVKGKLFPELSVAMREIALEDTTHSMTGYKTKNEAITVYDTSGPYTDLTVDIDIHKGLDRIREP